MLNQCELEKLIYVPYGFLINIIMTSLDREKH